MNVTAACQGSGNVLNTHFLSVLLSRALFPTSLMTTAERAGDSLINCLMRSGKLNYSNLAQRKSQKKPEDFPIQSNFPVSLATHFGHTTVDACGIWTLPSDRELFELCCPSERRMFEEELREHVYTATRYPRWPLGKRDVFLESCYWIWTPFMNSRRSRCRPHSFHSNSHVHDKTEPAELNK